MDITAQFISVVKERRKRLKSSGSTINDEDIFPKSKDKCPYILKYKDVVKQISKLKVFLLDKRKSYMNLTPANFIYDNEMSDSDRDQVDTQAQYIIKTYTQLVSAFKKETYNIDEDNQEIDNRKAILDLIESYLKVVCKIYTEQKAIRVKLTVELQKMSKLTQDNLNFKEYNSLKQQAQSTQVDDNNDKSLNNSDQLEYSTFVAANEIDQNDLTEEEMQMFKMENEHLYNELNSLNDEVKDIQSKVIKIAELQEVFTDKVMEQTDEIERISTTLVGTTENVKDANVQIRQAIQSNASLRIYLLFFLMVMSFSLLFLDWYND